MKKEQKKGTGKKIVFFLGGGKKIVNRKEN
jgi:hypothetical protein